MTCIKPPRALYVKPDRRSKSLNAYEQTHPHDDPAKWVTLVPLEGERNDETQVVFVALTGTRWIAYPKPPADPVRVIFAFQVAPRVAANE